MQHTRIQILILGFKGLSKLNQKLAAAMKNVSSFLRLKVFHFFKKKFLQDVSTTYSHVTPVFNLVAFVLSELTYTPPEPSSISWVSAKTVDSMCY